MKCCNLCFCFFLFALSVFGQKWQKIETDKFTFEIPKEWMSENENASRVVEMKSLNLRQYALRWDSPENESPTTWNEGMLLKIESYESLDTSPLSFEQIYEMAMANPGKTLNVKKKQVGEGLFRIEILEEDMEVSMGKIKRYHSCRHVLMCYDKDLAHVVTIKCSESLQKEQPEKLKDIEYILNSFSVK